VEVSSWCVYVCTLTKSCQGSASESCLTAAIAARERALNRLYQQQGDLQVEGAGLPQTIRDRYAQKLVMYGSTQTHSLGAKVRLRREISAERADFRSGGSTPWLDVSSGARVCE
jgi:hypothetical protein